MATSASESEPPPVDVGDTLVTWALSDDEDTDVEAVVPEVTVGPALLGPDVVVVVVVVAAMGVGAVSAGAVSVHADSTSVDVGVVATTHGVNEVTAGDVLVEELVVVGPGVVVAGAVLLLVTDGPGAVVGFPATPSISMVVVV
jgi:hypothetical protein